MKGSLKRGTTLTAVHFKGFHYMHIHIDTYIQTHSYISGEWV